LLTKKRSEQINSGPQVTDFTSLPADGGGEFVFVLRFEHKNMLERIGAGGFGSVYKAFQSTVGRPADRHIVPGQPAGLHMSR
jgi:hypothetical protein